MVLQQPSQQRRRRRRMHPWVALALILVVIGPAVAAGSAAVPAGDRESAGGTLRDLHTRPFWVFFRDRGPAAADADAVGDAEPAHSHAGQELLARVRAVSLEAWARRARTGHAMLPDERDRELCGRYVDAVAEHGDLRCRSRWLNAVSAELTPAGERAVRQLAFVAAVRPVAVAQRHSLGPQYDTRGRPLGRVTAPQPRAPLPVPAGMTAHDLLGSGSPFDRTLVYGPSLWQLEEIQVPPVHELGYSGNRVRFMMLDTGFRTDHDAFAETDILGEWDYVFGDGTTQNEEEDHPNAHSHGTATWGASGGYAPGILIGPGYGATFLLAKTEDIRSETQVEEDYYVAALEWADSAGVAVTSASLCYLCFDDGFCYEYEDKDGDTAVITVALDIAAQRGITCVNCMGNYGCGEGTLGTPADADSMIAVGAVDSLNQIAEWSACGPTFDGRTKPEVLARGVHTFCADDDETDTYGYASGTSLSTPLVGGAVALLLEAHPEWGPMDVRAALTETADRADSPDNQYGWGRIDVAAALEWSPVLFPRPFSLVSPADSAQAPSPLQTFVWRATEDPDEGGPITYTLWIDDLDDPGDPWCIDAGADTSVTLPFSLEVERVYRWEVTAEDQTGHRRESRERHTLIGPDAGAVPSPPLGRLRISCAPNPFSDRVHFLISLAPGAAPPPDAETAMRWAVYDPLGRRLAQGSALGEQGQYRASWDGLRADGLAAPSGVYYLELRQGQLFARETLVRLTR